MKYSLSTLAPRIGVALVSLFAASSVQAKMLSARSVSNSPVKPTPIAKPNIVLWGDGTIKPGGVTTNRAVGRKTGRAKTGIKPNIVLWGDGTIKPGGIASNRAVGRKTGSTKNRGVKPNIVLWGDGTIKPNKP